MSESLEIYEKDSVELSVVKRKDANVSFCYKTLNGNDPKANENFVGIWQGKIIPSGKRAIFSQKIEKSYSESNWTLVCKELKSDDYVIGYCQTGNPKENENACNNVSASAIIPKNNELLGVAIDRMNLFISGDSSSAILEYTTLNSTKRDLHWFGIWKGGPTISQEDKPLFVQKITEGDPDKSGVIPLNMVDFTDGWVYTLAYFANGWENKNISNMVAYIQFKI